VQDQSSSNYSAGTTKKHSRLRRILLWCGGIFLFLVICTGIVIGILLHRSEPILRQRVIDTLSARFDSRVELDHFHVYFLNGFQVRGSGLKLWPNRISASQPLFAVDEFGFHTDWHGLLHSPMTIGLVRLKGLAIHLPPKQERHNLPKLSGDSGGGVKIFVNKMLVENASLVLGTNKPGKVPLEFDIHNLQLQSIGAGQPMRFHAILTNPKPIGDIDSSGHFGPFDAHSPGDTPVDGIYSFTHADLNSIKGIGGILSSQGKYAGTLDNIVVDGETNTPDFEVDSGGHPMPLHTKFHAIVDGTNGDTYLQPVDAMLAHTHILAKGDVVRAPQGGHNITLDVTVGPARMEDVLQLGVKTLPPLMSGDLKMKTKFFLPPGPDSVTQKLQLKGNFSVSNVTFASDKVQSKVDELSLRSQGHAKEAKEMNKENPLSIQSQMSGQFQLANGKATFPSLKFNVPGADISLQGLYTMDGKEYDFHGDARLTAKVSQLTTGWKSILLKPVDPFFSKNGAGTEVPIRITGSRNSPKFGLDFGRKDESKNQPDLKGRSKDYGIVESLPKKQQPK
jgi:hypothetical protein